MSTKSQLIFFRDGKIIDDISRPTIFLIGASGRVGKSTLTHLHKLKALSKFRIIAGVRSTQKGEKLKLEFGVDYAIIDLEKPNTLEEPFKKVNKVFLVLGNVEFKISHTRAVL
jgi:uncharacterized protein YbjT (DUF2867 family)